MVITSNELPDKIEAFLHLIKNQNEFAPRKNTHTQRSADFGGVPRLWLTFDHSAFVRTAT